ncbi:MAG: Nif3-like dinuclear metal center hexameric protein [Bacteroidales bacterium]|nr:Nif3-like dinuclear metal center hexameric protein [Bacteroidales bacterium]
MKVKDIIAAIEEFAPAGIQAEYDNTGLQVGSPEQDVHGVLIGFDCTEALVEEAVGRGCDMILTHHPLIYHPLRNLYPEDPGAAAVIAAVKNGVAVYGCHTSADKTPGGVSFALAEKIGLKNVRVLAPEEGGVGFGAVGDLPEALPSREAVALVKKALGTRVARCSTPIDRPVDRIAVCGGSGTSLIPAAIKAGARMYVCGDVSYHYFFQPEGFMVVDAGHFETEVEITQVLLSVIRKKFPTFVSLISENIGKANPVNYL